jgi:hypothetical protein
VLPPNEAYLGLILGTCSTWRNLQSRLSLAQSGTGERQLVISPTSGGMFSGKRVDEFLYLMSGATSAPGVVCEYSGGTAAFDVRPKHQRLLKVTVSLI